MLRRIIVLARRYGMVKIKIRITKFCKN